MNNTVATIVAVALLLCAPLCAAEDVAKTDLFAAGEGGYALYRIPGVVVTAKGTVVAYCEARRNSASDWGQIDVVMRRSADGGRTWGPARKVVEPPADARKNPVAAAQKLGKPGEITVNNPVAIADKSGAVHFLYCVEYARCFYVRSDDDGETFSAPVEVTAAFESLRPTYDWKVVATGPGHGIQLKTGRLLVPAWLSTGTGGHAHRPSCVATIYSDDGGRTWAAGEIVVSHPDPVNPSETAAAELDGGRVMLNVRHESEPRLRAVVVGPDGAKAWGKVRYDEALPETVCMAGLVKVPRGPLLFSNPHNPGGRERKNLTVKLSEDEGATWKASRVLEPGASAYSDLAVAPDGTVFCFYERGGAAGDSLRTGRLTMARFGVDWVKGSEPVGR